MSFSFLRTPFFQTQCILVLCYISDDDINVKKIMSALYIFHRLSFLPMGWPRHSLLPRIYTDCFVINAHVWRCMCLPQTSAARVQFLKLVWLKKTLVALTRLENPVCPTIYSGEELVDSCLPQGHQREVKRKQLRPGFELSQFHFLRR